MATVASGHGDDVPLLTDVCPERPPPHRRVFPAKQIHALSIALIVFGGCSMVFNGVGFVYNRTQLTTSQGFYCGAGFIATGIVGIIAAKKKTKCMTITVMIMSMISAAAFATCQFALSIVAIVSDTTCHYWDCFNPLQIVAIVMAGLLVICSILAVSMSIRIAVLCCQYYWDCCARGDCSCCDLEESATNAYVPMFPATSVPGLPPPYAFAESSDGGAMAAAGNHWQLPHQQQQQRLKQERNNSSSSVEMMRQLSQLPPAQLQFLLQLSQMSQMSQVSQMPQMSQRPQMPQMPQMSQMSPWSPVSTTIPPPGSNATTSSGAAGAAGAASLPPPAPAPAPSAHQYQAQALAQYSHDFEA